MSMDARKGAWSVVVVGYWNRMIFSPEWVAEHLFKTAEIEKLIPLMPDAPLIYQNNDVELHVLDTRVSVLARNSTLEGLTRAADMACAILDLLPNTPIQAVGINVGFDEPQPEDRLLELFNADDLAEINSEGWQIEKRILVRQLSREGDGRTLNLKLTFQPPEVMVDANFHQQVAKANEARDALTGRAAETHSILLTLLEAAYGLNVKGETADV
jgi:hypothetical protein